MDNTIIEIKYTDQLLQYKSRLLQLQLEVQRNGNSTSAEIIKEIEDIHMKVTQIELENKEYFQNGNTLYRTSIRVTRGVHDSKPAISSMVKIMMEMHKTIKAVENYLPPEEVEMIIKNIIKVNNLAGEKKHVILFCAADPSDQPRLRLMQETRDIQHALRFAELRHKFILENELSARPVDITQSLLDHKPMIVHFSGHGTKHGDLCFEDNAGNHHLVSPEAAADLFEQFSSYVKCVLLNACFSEQTAQAISKHVDYVIGMNKEISDEAALAFSIGFYQAIGTGKTYEKSFRFGILQMKLQRHEDEAIVPFLYQNGIQTNDKYSCLS